MYAKCCCRSPTRKCTERSAYLDLALIFLLFRFSLLILFFLHFALIAKPTTRVSARIELFPKV